MTLQQLEATLLALPPHEKSQAIQLLNRSLNPHWRGIEKTAGVCGGRACIAKTRIPVWVLVEARRLGFTEAQLLDNYPTLCAIDLANAWLYADIFSDEIEYDIQENNPET